MPPDTQLLPALEEDEQPRATTLRRLLRTAVPRQTPLKILAHLSKTPESFVQLTSVPLKKNCSHKQICLRGENIEIVRSIFVGCHVALIFQRKIGPREQVIAKFPQTLFP